jgi:hypothetical protein
MRRMDTDAIPLELEDRTILGVECATIAGHTCKIVSVDGATDVDALRASVAERIGAAPLLTRKLGGSEREPTWVVDDAFDLDRHIVAAPVDEPLDEAGLRAEVARLFEQRLDRSRPLWQIDVVPTEAGSALIWRIHHALADGTTSMRYAKALLWDPEPTADPAAAAVRDSAAHAADDARRRHHLGGFLHREFARSRTRSPFDGRIGARREVAFAEVSLSELHDAARRLCGAKLNDAVLSVVAGALRRWMLEHHGALGDVRVKVPVSLHREGDDAGNRDSFFSVALPLNEADPVARLRAVHAATTERKTDHDAETLDTLTRDLARVSPALQRFVHRIEESPRRFAVNVSNVPGPRQAVSVLGAAVSALHSIAEIGERHALRVTAISVADRLCFGFCADPGIVEDLEAMADGVVAETDALVRSTA